MNGYGWARKLVGFAACLSVLPGSGVVAHAEPVAVDVRTTDGLVVGVGDVIAVGQRSGNTCRFPDGAGVVMTLTSGSASTTLRIDDMCRVSIQEIVTHATELNLGGNDWSSEPKHPDGASGTVPVAMPAVGGSVVTAVLGVVASGKPPKTPEPPEPFKLWTGSVTRTFRDAANREQWQDQIQLNYAQGVNSGTIVSSSVGDHTDCRVKPVDPTDLTALAVNTKSNCAYHQTSATGPYAELNGGGDYQQTLVGQVLAEAQTREVFIVTKTDYSGSCPIPTSAPFGWSMDCYPSRTPRT